MVYGKQFIHRKDVNRKKDPRCSTNGDTIPGSTKVLQSLRGWSFDDQRTLRTLLHNYNEGAQARILSLLLP